MNSANTFWTPYIPTAKAPWTLRRIVHLHRRAGFAASWSELQRDLKEGPQASLDRILGSTQRKQVSDEHLLAPRTPNGVFEPISESLADAAVTAKKNH